MTQQQFLNELAINRQETLESLAAVIASTMTCDSIDDYDRVYLDAIERLSNMSNELLVDHAKHVNLIDG